MSILNLLEHVPVWVKTSVSIMLVFGLLWWRIFRHWLKLNRILNKMKDETYADIQEVSKEILEENRTLRKRVKELENQINQTDVN